MSKILIIDDDKALCHSLEIQLQEIGYEVTSVHTIKDGLETSSALRPAITLLDMHLPDDDGIKSLPDFLQISPTSVIIIMTGDPDNMAVARAMTLGAFDYLRKPLDRDDLLSVIEKGLQHQHILGHSQDDSANTKSHEHGYEIMG